METSLNQTLWIGIGHSSQPDAFQNGRESAQMALNQIKEKSVTLILALGPAKEKFQDFIEGVRLVLGSQNLIGIPSRTVFTNDSMLNEAGLVMVLHSTDAFISTFASHFPTKETARGVTEIFSGFRTSRGNQIHNYQNHGLLFFENNVDINGKLSASLSAEAGFDYWMIHLALKNSPLHSMICGDAVVSTGLIGVEILNNRPWGLGWVPIKEFKNVDRIYIEAIRSAIRQAQTAMKNQTPAFVFLLFDFPLDQEMMNDIYSLLKKEGSLLEKTPVIGISTRRHELKPFNRGLIQPSDSIIALLLPK